ncbi:MFS transporter [Corynebacterium macginleyi]|uniref:MFS transporter n=1 Tax=Corynebacterium macginleyi TaxID=38290 RepID=UPI00190A5981|nr:MFS transporter [Corynebacterium macginleyi]
MLLAALLLSTGKIADTWGRKRAFLAGLTIFVAGSVLAGFSTTAATLISARGVQAIGVAFIMPSPLSTVNAGFRGRYRAAAFGEWFAVVSGAAVVGPLAAGALTEWVSWHWIFLVNMPVGIIVAIGAVLTVRETCSPDKLPGVYLDGAQLRLSPLPPWSLRLLRARPGLVEAAIFI